MGTTNIQEIEMETMPCKHDSPARMNNLFQSALFFWKRQTS